MAVQSLAGKTVLVTGGARGIGRAISQKLASHGANIIINYFNSSEEAETLCSELTEAYQVKTLAVCANVADVASMKEMITEISETFETIDLLVSNAASGVLRPMMKMTPKHWRHCMETNALALPMLVKETLSLMPRGSKVLALSSLGSQRSLPDYGFIGASKAALESLARSLSVELAEHGVSVNVVSAGAVDTDALKYFPERDRLLNESKERSLAGRNITPDDVANVAYLLCLPESDMIRGQTIHVDAGYSIVG